MSDDLDEIDNLLNPPPPPAGPVAAVNDLTEEQRARVLAGKEGDQKGQAEALDALSAAVEHYQKGQQADVVAEAAAASAVGVPVDVAALILMGALPAVPPEPADLDALTPEAEAAEKELDASPAPLVRDTINPLELPEDPAMVPVYNPRTEVVDLQFNGRTYPIRPGGIDLAHVEAVRLGVGVDNQGGTFSRFGVRRLFGPEPRFEGIAAEKGLSLVEYARRRNVAVVMLADGIAGRTQGAVAEELAAMESRAMEIPEEAK